jgi:hypothetical protein
MPEVLEQYGRFLAPDYRVLFESLEIPSIFEEDLTPSGRRFVIIGGDDNPALLAKNVFLCAKLSGAESVDIRSHYMDELFLAQNVLENHADGIRHKVHMPLFEGIHLNQGWYDAIEQATDIIVYGSDHTISMYREYENVDRAVWEYPERFSLGVIRSDSIDYGMAAEMCFDFVCYYGHGRLAPKFYFVVGPITKKVINTISECIYALFRDAIEEYRNKLPLTRKSDFTQKYMNAHYASYYLRIGKLTDKDLFDSLYGDIKLVQVNDIDEVEQFIVKYRDKISTVAVDYDDEETFETICDLAVPRLCGVGEMQFPDFFEQYDIVDDFEIYVKNEEE